MYTPRESNDFLEEVENNKKIRSSPRFIKMTKFVGAYLDMEPFIYRDTKIDHYSYITLPFIEKGSLIEPLIKAN